MLLGRLLASSFTVGAFVFLDFFFIKILGNKKPNTAVLFIPSCYLLFVKMQRSLMSWHQWAEPVEAKQVRVHNSTSNEMAILLGRSWMLVSAGNWRCFTVKVKNRTVSWQQVMVKYCWRRNKRHSDLWQNAAEVGNFILKDSFIYCSWHPGVCCFQSTQRLQMTIKRVKFTSQSDHNPVCPSICVMQLLSGTTSNWSKVNVSLRRMETCVVYVLIFLAGDKKG